jgi:hypothetical protein
MCPYKNGAASLVYYQQIKHLLNIFFIIMWSSSKRKFLLAHADVCSVNWGALLFPENTTTGVICLDMLEAFCFPRLDENENPDVMFQQDGAGRHFSKVRDVNDRFPERWIRRRGPILWPPVALIRPH